MSPAVNLFPDTGYRTATPLYLYTLAVVLVFNWISASLFLFPTSSTFTILCTHTITHNHTHIHCAKVISFILTRVGWRMTGWGGGLLFGFSFIFHLVSNDRLWFVYYIRHNYNSCSVMCIFNHLPIIYVHNKINKS